MEIERTAFIERFSSVAQAFNIYLNGKKIDNRVYVLLFKKAQNKFNMFVFMLELNNGMD